MIAAPATNGKNVVNRRNAFNSDIIEVLESNYPTAVANVKTFAQQFRGSTDQQTAHNVWNFLRSEIRYKRDPAHRQLIRIPGRFFHDGEGDCKSYSLAACSILSNLGFKTAFRYTSYSGSNVPTHVYCIAEKNGKKFIVDGVYHTFNAEKPYTFKTDHTMNIETLSGINGNQTRKQFDLNNRQHLQTVLNRIGNKNKLVALIIQKKLSGDQRTLPYTPAQLAQYRIRLNNAINNVTVPFVKQLLQEEANKVASGTIRGGIFGTGEDHEIGKLKIGKRLKAGFKKVGAGLKKVGKGLKKIGLAPNRAAFLGLVRLNVKGLATKLQKSNQAKLKKTWEKIGGSYSKLMQTVNAGAKRKSLGGTEGMEIGVIPPAVASALALAAPIIAILAKLFKPQPGDSLNPMEEGGTENLLNTFDTLKTAAIDAGVLPEKLYAGDAMANDIENGNAEVTDSESGFGGMMIPLAVAAVAVIAISKK